LRALPKEVKDADRQRQYSVHPVGNNLRGSTLRSPRWCLPTGVHRVVCNHDERL